MAGYIVPVVFIERPCGNLNPRHLGVQHAAEHILQVRPTVRLLLPIDQGDGRHHIVRLVLRLHGYMRAWHLERTLLVVKILGEVFRFAPPYVLELLHSVAIVGHHLQIYKLVLLATIHRGHAAELRGLPRHLIHILERPAEVFTIASRAMLLIRILRISKLCS